MSMRKRLFGVGMALAVVVAGGCGPGAPDGGAARKALRGTGYGGGNSHIREGGVVGNTRIAGLYHSEAEQTGTGFISPTGWWMSTTSTELYAPIMGMTYQSEPVLELTSNEGVFYVSTGAGLQPLIGKDFELLLAVGEPLHTSLRISSAQIGAGYNKYDTQAYSQDSGAWESFCPHPYEQNDGTQVSIAEYVIPVAGAKWALNGSQTEDLNAIRLSCTHDFVGGCIEWGYAPWKTDDVGTSLRETHQACGRMKREDICGNGDPVTTSGLSYDQHTNIELWDSLGIHSMLPHTNTTREAGWSAGGATCFNPGKYRSSDPDLHQRLRIQLDLCPKPACTATNAGIVGSARPCLTIDANGKCTSN